MASKECETHTFITSTADPILDHDDQERSDEGKQVEASVYDTVKSKAKEHESDTSCTPTGDATPKHPAEKETKRKSFWNRRGKRSSVVKPADRYGK